MKAVIPLMVVVMALPGCAEEEDLPLFRPDEAITLVKTLRRHWAAGSHPDLLGICGEPFVFNGRTWASREELESNLKEQLPRLKRRVAQGEQIEAFGTRELQRGNWPRGMKVPEDQREARIRQLGLESDGYLVRIYTPPQRGWLAIVNPKGAAKLQIRGLAF